MRRFNLKLLSHFAPIGTGLLLLSPIVASDKPPSTTDSLSVTKSTKIVAQPGEIIQVQQGESDRATIGSNPLGRDTQLGPNPFSSGLPSSPSTSNTQPNTTAPANPPSTGATSDVSTAGGQASGVYNAGDVGELLTKSPNTTGVQIQQRNGIMSDPRVRGYRVGQLVTIGDGAFYFPARQDLDTAVAKFDSYSVANVGIFRGPYTSMLGSGFAFFDVSTLNAPRYDCGFEIHGRSALTFQTNGNRWDALQSVEMGDRDWGLRLNYNYLQGNGYDAGDGSQIATGYLSNNVSLALGFNLTDKSTLELKILNVHQSGLEFPGLYFDIRNLETQSYSMRYTLNDQNFFDKFTMDVWYNSTTANGDTTNAVKQAFVQKLLAVSFNPDQIAGQNPANIPTNQFVNQFTDSSTTNFNNQSLGYRAAMWWGGGKNAPTFVAGTDLNILGQNLIENIKFTQTTGFNLNTGQPITNPEEYQTYNQTQTIPDAKLVNPGLFVETSLPFGELLTVRAGGRLDFVRTSSGPRLITGDVTLAGPGTELIPGIDPGAAGFLNPEIYSVNPDNHANERTFTLFSGFLSSDWRLSENMIFTGGYAHAMRAPTLTELYATGPFVGMLQQGTNRIIGDANLDPETLDQIDLSLKYSNEYFRGSISGFYAFIQNYITFDQNVSSPGINQIIFTNTNLATLAGTEIYGQVETTCMTTVFASASYVQGTDMSHRDNRRPDTIASSRRNDPTTQEYAVSTEALPQIPPFEFRYGLRFHEAVNMATTAPKWSIEFAGRSVLAQNYVAASLNEQPTPGFTTFNIRGYWQASKNVLLTTGVENLTNAFYREHLDPISGNLIGVDPFYRSGINYYFGCQLTY